MAIEYLLFGPKPRLINGIPFLDTTKIHVKRIVAELMA